MISSIALTLTLTLALAAQAQPPVPADEVVPDNPAARLDFMKTSLGIYDLRPTEGRSGPFRLQPEPIFRLNNNISGVKDGAIFFWLDEAGRPAASVQVFVIPSGLWLHEFTSLVTFPMVAERRSAPAWSPARAGVEFRPIPDAPKPADTPEGRLRQMRALAQDFGAEDYFETKTWHHLRLLPKPLARYGKPGAAPTDGALFGLVLGSDPETFLMIEARPGPDGPAWQYAFAPMTCYPLKGTHKGKLVWELPLRLDQPMDQPFTTRQYHPAVDGP